MTNDQRLDRLERMLEKCLRTGEQSQRNMRGIDAKIQILIDAQTKYEERFGKISDREAKYNALFAMYNERFAKSDERFKKFEKQTDRVEEMLMKIERELQE